MVLADDPGLLTPTGIKDNFYGAVKALFDTTYDLYGRYQNVEVEALASRIINRTPKQTFTKDDMRAICIEAINSSMSLEKSLKQSRAARAGMSFEIIIKSLLEDIGIQSERVTREVKSVHLRRIDLVIPDKKTAIEAPDKAHFLSLKTSLKERWMQVAAEQAQGQRTHLVTILQGEILSNAVAMKIIDRGIFLYVPDPVKNDRFPKEPKIRQISDIPRTVSMN